MKKYILILFSVFAFGQSGLIARQNFAHNAASIGINTEIGGVAATISTPALLATRLGISVGAISNFSIVGSDIKCKITGNYAIPANAFDIFTYPSLVSLTYYRDNANLVTSIGAQAFIGTSNLAEKLIFNSVTSVGSDAFTNCSKLPEIHLPLCTSLSNVVFRNCFLLKVSYTPLCTNFGGTSGNDSVFNMSMAGAIIYVHPSLATNNGGNPDGDLAYAITQSATIRYVSNFTAPNAITDLSAGVVYNQSIKLDFTTPSSTNTIDYYDVYVGGIFNSRYYSGNDLYAVNLTAATNYNITVYVTDIYLNKSLISNILNTTTTNVSDSYYVTDTDATAYLTAAGISGTTEVNACNFIFYQLKNKSLYTKIQAFYPFLGTTAAQHKWNGKKPLDTDAAFRITFNGTAAFSNSGYTPNGSNGYANTYFTPSIKQNVNSNGLTVVCGTNNAAAGSDVVDIGSFNSGTQKSYVILKNNNSTYARIVGLNSTNISLTGVNESRGIFTGTKQSATVTDFFINGSQVGTVNSGGTLPTYNIYIGAMNYIGGLYGYSNQRFQFTAFHEGLSDSEVMTFHTIIDTFETALGRKTW